MLVSKDGASSHIDSPSEITHESDVSSARYCTVTQLANNPQYPFLSKQILHHYIFRAEPRTNSRGETIPGNGLDKAILRIGRRVLIDVQEFENWLQTHRVKSLEIHD